MNHRDDEQIARFFFVKIQIAITSSAKRARRDDVVALVEIASVGLDQVVQEDVVDAIPFARNSHQAGNFSGHRHHAEVGCARLRVMAQLESHT